MKTTLFYTGDVTCPQCGNRSTDLRDEWRPRIEKKLGANIQLRCFVCGHRWLAKVKEEGL